MGSINYGNQTFDVLDYGVETSSPRRKYTESPKSFSNRAEAEMKELSAEDLRHYFITVYSDSGYTYHSGDAKVLIRLSLTGQNYICPKNVKQMIFCITSAVYHEANGKSELIWKLERLKPNQEPVFLRKSSVEKAFHRHHKQVEIKLGALAEKHLTSIAWQVTTEKGIFYVLWHNGSIIEATGELTFTEKEFSELKRTYAVLRFARCMCTEEAYRIICA